MNQGEFLKNEGMNNALIHADKAYAGWSSSAINYLRQYPEDEFLAEDVSAWAYKQGLAIPPSKRAWGSVMVSANKQGFIERVGHKNVKNPRAHATPASLWRKVDK